MNPFSSFFTLLGLKYRSSWLISKEPDVQGFPLYFILLWVSLGVVLFSL